jgi:2-iminobutanoate/2-iminopropanoate deaminase
MSADAKPRKVIVEGDAVGRPIGPYSHAVVAGGFVFVSGQGPRDAKTGRFVQGGIREQTGQTMRNVLAVLTSLDLDLSDVVKVNAYLSDIRDFDAFNEAYGTFFEGVLPPARTTLQAVLPREGMLVEIEVTAKTRS